MFDLDGTIYSGEYAYLSMVNMPSGLPVDKVWFLSRTDSTRPNFIGVTMATVVEDDKAYVATANTKPFREACKV